jgi:hypothetical protein
VSSFLAAVARRLKLAWGFATGQALGPLVAVLALAAVGFGFLAPVWWAEPLAIGMGAAAAVAVFVWAVLLRVPEPVAARAADRGMATKDAFATALQVRESDSELAPYVVRRAEGLAAGARADEAVPMPVKRRRLLATGLVAAAALGLGFVPNHQDDVRARRAAEHAAIDDIVDDLRDQAAALADDPSATDAQKAEAEALEQLAEELSHTDSLEEAQQRLEQAEAEMTADVSSALEAQRAAAVGLERSLATQPLPGASADQSASEQLKAAADGLDGMSAEDQAALAQQLEQLATGQEVANPDLAAALSDAAAALQAGDTAGARAALGEAAAAQDAASASVAAQDAAADGAARVGDAQAQLDQQASGEASGDPSKGQQGQGQAPPCPDDDGGKGDASTTTVRCVPGQGQGQGSGQGQGQGQGSGSGSGSGRGSGSGSGSGASGNVGGSSAPTGSGQGGVGRPNGSGNNPSVGLDTSGQNGPVVYDPGDQLDAGGVNGGTDPGQTVGRGNGQTGSGAAFVPLSDVIADYRDRAGRAVERADIPPSQRDLVRDYFDTLANGGTGQP